MSRSFAHDPPPFPPAGPPPASPAPEPFGVPPFDPLRVRGSGRRLSRALLRQRRTMSVGLAMTAAALAGVGAGGSAGATADAGTQAKTAAGGAATGAPAARRRPAEIVSAPVRIADAATVRLLQRGDRVDVIAAATSPSQPMGRPQKEVAAWVVAAGVRVTEIPDGQETSTDGGALVVLSVPRATARELAGAAATSQLALALC